LTLSAIRRAEPASSTRSAAAVGVERVQRGEQRLLGLRPEPLQRPDPVRLGGLAERLR
jgi:hypothetical protein